MARSRSGFKPETSDEKVSLEEVDSVESDAKSLAPVSIDTDTKSKILEPKVAPPLNIEPVKQYRVMNESRVLVNGQIFILRAGRVVDESHYNIPLLQSQGVKLEAM